VYLMKAKKKSYLLIPGTVHIGILLPEALHQQMKAIRQARRQQEAGDVQLYRLYREAVEHYVNAKPQQRLLEETGRPKAANM
jgi:hypothetical protein